MSCGVAMLCAGLLFRETPPASMLTVLDLKRGRAALVETPGGGAALIDAGARGEGNTIAESLRRSGVRRLALLVVTADDSDAIGGATELLKRVPTSRVLLPRAGSASPARRELERFLAERAVPYGSPGEFGNALNGPGDARWEFRDDGPPPNMPAAVDSSIAVRVSMPGCAALVVSARSGAALERLLAGAGAEFFKADFLCLYPGRLGHWPTQTAQLLSRSECRAVIAGGDGYSESDDPASLDLAKLAEERGAQLYRPRKEGSLRLQAQSGMEHALRAYRDGAWRGVE